MSDYKLLGHDYTTPDLIAKVTGRARYAEDYRADGMVFCKLLLSPMPHCRVRRIDAREALAMPGVRGILTADDLPARPKMCQARREEYQGDVDFFFIEGMAVHEPAMLAVRFAVIAGQNDERVVGKAQCFEFPVELAHETIRTPQAAQIPA